MATPAALLQVLVEANTLAARNDLARFNSQLKAVDKTTATATTRTSTLGKTTRTAGSHLRSAAGYAASAAAAYLSISQAKAAVTTTQDLAKTTAGLSRNLGLSAKKASQWGSVAKARDIDAKSLTMSFTTLSRRITDAAKGSDTAVDSFKDIGVTTKDLDSTQGNFNKQLLLVADAFGEAEGGATRQQAAQKLLGRGYQTLLPLFSEGSKSLKEQQMWADKYGTTLNQKTLKAQMDLINAQRESKVAWLGLQVVFTKALTPALMDANKEFQKIAKIMGSDKLTNEEKFKRVSQIIGKWATKAFDAFVAILPKLTEKALAAGPRIATALLEGFMNAPVWGKLLGAGLLITKFGGWAAFGKLGTKAGTVFGKRFGPGMVIGLALFGPELLKTAFDLGKKAGEALEDAFKGVADPKLGAPLSVSPDIRAMQRRKGIESDAKVTLSVGEKLAKDMRILNREIEQDSKQHQDAQARITEHGLRRVTEENKDGLNLTEREFRETHGKLNKETRDQTRDVVGNTNNMVNAVGGGLRTLGKNTNNALKGFGAKTLAFKIELAKSGAQSGFQRGGPINQGAPSGDSVPALLEKGEYVVNRRAVAAVGKGNLDRLNFGAAARFAKGGMVDPAGPGTGVVNAAIAKVVGAWSKKYNAAINYGYDPGGGHVSPGHNITGTATDTSPAAGWGSGPTALFEKGLQSLVGQGLQVLYGSHGVGTPYPNHGFGNHAHIEWGSNPDSIAMFKRLGRVMLKGPDGPLKSMGQGSLDKARQAANAFLKKKSMISGRGDLGSFGGGGVMSKGEIAKVWSAANGGQGSAGLMAAIALAESSGNPKAVGQDPGGTRGLGLWQITTGFNDDLIRKYGGESGMFNPLNNAKAAGEILARQGLRAWVVYSSGAYQQFMKKGGLAGMQGGGIPGAPPGFDMGKFGTAHMKMAQIPGLRKRIQKLTGRIGKTDESIGIAQTLAGLSTSPGGSELSSGEKNQQVGLLERLMGHLVKQKQFASMGLRLSKRFNKPPGFFKDVLTEVQGVTGRGGRIFDTSIALKELQATPLAGAGGISIDDLLRIREGATLGLFGGLSSGGAAPAPSAAAPSAAPQVNINYANGMEWLRDFVSVQVDGRDRRTNIRSLAGVRR